MISPGTIINSKREWQCQDLSEILECSCCRFKNIVPPLLVYADLITTTDKRCHETANMRYDKYIQPNL
ncbi:MAG: hypothetical protein IPL55_19860 [Saprospiraceae bacterium]|nr:hypothetical protein [Saprospiraceae bacterium]